MEEFPDWLEYLFAQFEIVYKGRFTDEKASPSIWKVKKLIWLKALSKFRIEAIEDGMNAAIAGRLLYPLLPEFCLICEEYQRTKKYDPEVPKIKFVLSPEQKARNSEKIKELIRGLACQKSV